MSSQSETIQLTEKLKILRFYEVYLMWLSEDLEYAYYWYEVSCLDCTVGTMKKVKHHPVYVQKVYKPLFTNYIQSVDR